MTKGKRFLVACALSLIPIWLSGCSTTGGGGKTSESILMPFLVEEGELTWEVAHSAGNEREHVDEWVRPGQTLDDWTELVTVQAPLSANMG